MKIVVTPLMIQTGLRGNCRQCPLALGFAAEGYNVSVGTTEVDFYAGEGGEARHYGAFPLPAIAQHFQKRFDDFKPVDPFEFDMPGLRPGAWKSV